MAVLEICRRRLYDGILPTDPALKAAFAHIRDKTGAECVFYSAIEEPEIFFAIGLWPSMEVYHAFEASPEASKVLAPINKLSGEEWIEHIPINKLEDIPLEAPIMTVSRCFFKEYDDHPARYMEDVKPLILRIEEETKPWPYTGNWTTDSTDEVHKWIVFGGWRSKKHHQSFATKLMKEVPYFGGIPEHYDEKTVHRHCWNIERGTTPEMFEVLDGFVAQRPGHRQS
jgi:hypothetical protein